MFKVGDRVKFKTSSLQTGMIDANDKDVFEVTSVSLNHVTINQKGYIRSYHFNHLEHVKEEIMDNTEDQEIEWQVGQEVWCLVFGKGVVIEVNGANTNYPVAVGFGNDTVDYTVEGKYFSDNQRTLFFSEPKIEAEKFPPKKPFVPKLKKGDVIFLKNKDRLFGEGTVRTVYSELEDRIYISEDHDYFLKEDILSIRLLSEEIIFK